MNSPFAIHRRPDWRSILLRIGSVLCIGGGIVAVSTPAAGGTVFALGLLAMIGGICE